jgi:hypothetical protein
LRPAEYAGGFERLPGFRVTAIEIDSGSGISKWSSDYKD